MCRRTCVLRVLRVLPLGFVRVFHLALGWAIGWVAGPGQGVWHMSCGLGFARDGGAECWRRDPTLGYSCLRLKLEGEGRGKCISAHQWSPARICLLLVPLSSPPPLSDLPHRHHHTYLFRAPCLCSQSIHRCMRQVRHGPCVCTRWSSLVPGVCPDGDGGPRGPPDCPRAPCRH